MRTQWVRRTGLTECRKKRRVIPPNWGRQRRFVPRRLFYNLRSIFDAIPTSPNAKACPSSKMGRRLEARTVFSIR